MSVDPELEALAAMGPQLLAAMTEPERPPAEGRERLLASLSSVGRFDRFVPRVAAMADVPEAVAKGWLDQVWDGGTWERAAPGAMAWWVEGGPRTADCLRGFVRVGAGNEFPHHKHLGEEKVLVIQGHARLSDGGRLSAGDFTIGEDGAEHSFAVIPGGPDLLVFTVIHRGLDFGAFQARPRD